MTKTPTNKRHLPHPLSHSRVPSERNLHPYISGSIAVVLNGIIENYETLSRDLTAPRLTDMNLNDKTITFFGRGYLGLPLAGDLRRFWSVGGFVRLFVDTYGRNRQS